MNSNPFNIILLFGLTLFFLASGCSQNSDQRDFERAAYSEPEGFTQTDNSGSVISSDPDDWRVAPFFQGLVEVDPAFPNPVQTTGQVSIHMVITGVESVSGLWVFAFYGPNNLQIIYQDLQQPLPPGLKVVPLNPLNIAQFPENPQGIYRVVVTDGNENVITYGDIRVE